MAQTLTPTSTGVEFRVSTTTAGNQSEPVVTSLADGGFVVAWSSLSQDGSGLGVYAQRYSATGAKAGGEFLVNTTTFNSQFQPKIASLADGGFVVTWSSFEQDGSGEGVFGQRYTAAGAALGGEFRLNTTTFHDQMLSSAAGLTDGGFVVTWSSLDQDGSIWGVFAQRYAADGTAAGGEFRVNTTVLNDQYQPRVTALANGGFVVAWTSRDQDGSGLGVYAQRYAAGGTPMGSEFRVNTTTASDQYQPTILALTGGGLVVAWTSLNQDGSSDGIYAQRYTAAGAAAGSEFRVNTTTADSQSHPALTALADGGFTVAWTSVGQDGADGGIYAQRYTAAGAAAGSEFRVNTATADNQSLPMLATLADGGFVATWSSLNQDGSGEGVFAQRFSLPSGTVDAGLGVNAHDVNADGRSDIVLRGNGGEVVVWEMQGARITAGTGVANPGTYWNVAGVSDLNGDGKADIVMHGGGGEVVLWTMNGAQITKGETVAIPGTYWNVAGTGDFTGDGKADIVMHGRGGEVVLWTMNGGQITKGETVAVPGTYWNVADIGDYDSDGKADIVMRGGGGEVVIWDMDGGQITKGETVATPGTYWNIFG